MIRVPLPGKEKTLEEPLKNKHTGLAHTAYSLLTEVFSYSSYITVRT